MSGTTADQIVERIANANCTEPSAMRQRIEQYFVDMLGDPAGPYASVVAELSPGGKPDVDALVVALEDTLYDAMIPSFPGWEWDGSGYRNIRFIGKNP